MERLIRRLEFRLVQFPKTVVSKRIQQDDENILLVRRLMNVRKNLGMVQRPVKFRGIVGKQGGNDHDRLGDQNDQPEFIQMGKNETLKTKDQIKNQQINQNLNDSVNRLRGKRLDEGGLIRRPQEKITLKPQAEQKRRKCPKNGQEGLKTYKAEQKSKDDRKNSKRKNPRHDPELKDRKRIFLQIPQINDQGNGKKQERHQP